MTERKTDNPVEAGNYLVALNRSGVFYTFQIAHFDGERWVSTILENQVNFPLVTNWAELPKETALYIKTDEDIFVENVDIILGGGA